MNNNIYDAPQADLKPDTPVKKEDGNEPGDDRLKGLRGWLILVGIGVVLSPIRILLQSVPIYYPLIADGTFAQIFGPSASIYPPFFGSFLIVEILFNVGFLLGWIYAGYLFFSRHFRFPAVYIALIVASVFFILLDAWVLSLILPGEPLFDSQTAGEFGRVLLFALVWIPYMLLSKRVKATFVEHRPG